MTGAATAAPIKLPPTTPNEGKASALKSLTYTRDFMMPSIISPSPNSFLISEALCLKSVDCVG